MTYTANGRVQTVTDANDQRRPTSTTARIGSRRSSYPDGTTDEFAYNSQGNVIKSTDEREQLTTYSFDALEPRDRDRPTRWATSDLRLRLRRQPDQDQEPTPAGQTAARHSMLTIRWTGSRRSPIPWATRRFTGYDGDGNGHLGQGPAGPGHDDGFRCAGSPDRRHRPDGRTTTTTYDADGEDAHGDRPHGPDHDDDLFNIRGWVATVTDPLGNTATYSYNASARSRDRPAGEQQMRHQRRQLGDHLL